MRQIAPAMLMLFALSPIANAQPANRKLALLVKNCKAGESLCSTQELLSYRFENGEYVSKEVVLTTPTERVRYDFGGNLVFRNRYVITDRGDIVDVYKKELVHEGIGEFVGTKGQQIFSRVNRVDLKGVFVFDLNTNTYSRAKSPNIWDLEGELSPDQSKVARFEYRSGGKNSIKTAIVIQQIGGKRTLKAELGAECSERCNDLFQVPFVWIDNSKILTQKSNGEFIVLGLDGKVEPLLKIKLDEVPDAYPSFSRDEDGSIHYHWNGIDYWLDLQNKTFKENWAKLDDRFEISEGEGFWKTVYFDGQVIGKVWGDSFSTTKDWVALHYAEEGVNLGYPKGIKVWNALKRNWITIDISWGAEIIGWIEG